MPDWTSSPYKEALLFVGGNAFAAAAYFLKRWMQKDGDRERIELDAKTLELHRGLRQAGMSLEELRSFQLDFKAKRAKARKIEENVAYEIALDHLDGPAPGESQAEMNTM